MPSIAHAAREAHGTVCARPSYAKNARDELMMLDGAMALAEQEWESLLADPIEPLVFR